MQNLASTCAAGGSRAAAVLHAHQSLENDLSTAAALVTFVRKDDEFRGHLNPRAELRMYVSQLEDELSVCLRLCNFDRVMTTTNGLETVSLLYNQSASPSDRVQAFVQHVHRRLGALSPGMVYAAARCLQRCNIKVAGEMLLDFTTRYCSTFQSTGAGDDPQGELKRIIEGGDEASQPPILPELLSLQVECFAASGVDTHTVESQLTALRAVLPETTVEELLQLEGRCLEEFQRRQKRRCEKEERKLQHQTTVAPQSSPHTRAAAAEEGGKKGTPTTSDSLTNPLRLAGWKVHAIRAAMALFSAILLVLLSRTVVIIFRSLAHSTPRRKRLTL